MQDDGALGIRMKSIYCLCQKGMSREPTIIYVGGIIVAFMRNYLEGNPRDLLANAIRDGNLRVLAELQDVDFLV